MELAIRTAMTQLGGLLPQQLLAADTGHRGQHIDCGAGHHADFAGCRDKHVDTADLLAELAGIRLTDKRIERSPETDGAAAADRLTAESAAIACGKLDVLPAPADRNPAPDELYIAIDGTGVPMVAAGTAGRAEKSPDGRARTREVKLAALVTQTTVDDRGRPVRDPDSTSYVGSFAPAEQFAPWWPPRPAAAAPMTSANSWSSATAPPGSGHHRTT